MLHWGQGAVERGKPWVLVKQEQSPSAYGEGNLPCHPPTWLGGLQASWTQPLGDSARKGRCGLGISVQRKVTGNKGFVGPWP